MKPRETAWRYADARGNFRYRGAKENFDRDYAILKPDPLYDRDAVAVAVAAERERCAKLCEDKGPELLRWWGDGQANAACQECATAIRGEGA